MRIFTILLFIFFFSVNSVFPQNKEIKKLDGSEIGINRNFFNYLRTRSFNFKNQKKIEDFLKKIESKNE